MSFGLGSSEFTRFGLALATRLLGLQASAPASHGPSTYTEEGTEQRLTLYRCKNTK